MTAPQPRQHQVEALAHLTAALAIHDRTQLTMACGTGKTLVGRWHAQASDSTRVLVLLPSLALVAQTIREWRRATGPMATGWRFRAMVVCSDPTTTAGLAERRDSDDEIPITGATWDQVSARVTTDPAQARRFLEDDSPMPRVVFSTYHSSPVVAAAQQGSEHAFDLVICDEAHRLTGHPSEAFSTVLDARKIVARKRLFMTATPRAFAGDGASMDDPVLFGRVAHHVSFGEAIAAGMLTDYQVLVVADPEADDPATVLAGALAKAIDRHGLTRVLSFHGRVSKARAFAEAINDTYTPAGNSVTARHVTGSMPSDRRTETLEWLGQQGRSDIRVVSNARCLAEGVDVPAVDGILFADQRSSIVDIIQAIGRVLRPAPGKKVGTIVLPVFLPEDGDDDSALMGSPFAHVWTVLRGLRAHDARLAADIDRATREDARHRSNHHGGHRIPRIDFELPDGWSLPDVYVRLTREIGLLWERNYALAQQWAEDNGGRLMPRSVLVEIPGGTTVSLGEWGEQQRIAHRRGVLPQDLADRLEQLPGWAWDKAEARWTKTYALLEAYAAQHGTIAEHETGESRFAGMRDAETPRRDLGIWMATQRQAHRFGTLSPDRADRLEALPGWRWDAGLPQVDVDMVEALRMFVEFEKHAKVPDHHVEDGLRIGAWCWAVRRRRWTGNLAPALFDEILAATPSKYRPAERFDWEKLETLWRIGYFALRQYADREHALPTGRVIEELPDTTVGLGQWCALQRLTHRRGELDARYVELLEGIPGWQWEIELRTVQPGEPVQLRPGQLHGTAGAYSRPHNCRCAECLEWRRNKDNERGAAARAPKDPVDATNVREHLEQLEAAVIANSGEHRRNGRPLIAAVAEVPLGVLRRVMKGETTLERVFAERLLLITVDQVLSSITDEGSRGRPIAAQNSRVDPDPTFELLDDLAGRGFTRQWCGRELGYSSAGLQIYRDRKLTARIADAVARLHADIGDLVMPPLGPTARKPTLAELQAAAEDFEEAS